MTTDRLDKRSQGLHAAARRAPGAMSRREVLRRATALGTGAAALCALATSPAGAQGSRPGSAARNALRYQGDAQTLTIAADGSPSDLDPHSAYDYRSVLAILGAYEGLVRLKDDKTDEYEGLIAETWESNSDQSVWTFHLRDGVTFQDGSPCDAQAVLANYQRLFTLALGPIGVLGRFISDPASQISAPDAKTVVFDLGRPQPRFEAALASTYSTCIVNANAMKAHEDSGDWGHTWAQTNAEGTGTGPYKIVQFDPGQQLIMERNESYWGGWEGNHFDRIVIRVITENATRRQLIEQGEADIVDSLTPEDLDALAQNPDLVVSHEYGTFIDYFAMTVAGPLASPEARQAMCYAFPYDDAVQGVYRGYGKQAPGAVSDLCRGFNPDTFMYTTDLDKAKELFAKAGVAEGTELKLTMESGIERFKAAGQLLQNNLAKIGIKLNIEQIDLPAFTALFYGDAPVEERPNLMAWFWWPDYNDAWNHLYPQISCNSWGSKGANAGFYCNQQAESLLDQAKNAPDDATYTKALADLQQLISRDDPPSIYFVEPQWTTVLQKNVAGFVFNPVNLGTYNFWKMSRTT